MSTLNNDGINLSITTPYHRIGAVGVGIANVQPPPVQHRHVILIVVLAAAICPLQCPPHQCVDDLGSHTCGWSAQGFLPYSKYDVNGLILYGRYQGPLTTGHRLVGLRPATLSEK